MNCYRLFSRLLCALEGNYLETDCESMEHVDSLEHVQCLKFSCSIPSVTGRGFIEVGYCTHCKVFHPTRKNMLFHICCITYTSNMIPSYEFSSMVAALLIYYVFCIELTKQCNLIKYR